MNTRMVNPDPGETSAPDRHPIDPPTRLIDVRGPDERGACEQLAARWAEKYAPREGDHGSAALERFRAAHDYVNDVIHGIEPHTERS